MNRETTCKGAGKIARGRPNSDVMFNNDAMTQKSYRTPSKVLVGSSYAIYVACFAVFITVTFRTKGFWFKLQDIWDIPLTLTVPVAAAFMMSTPIWFWRKPAFPSVLGWGMVVLSLFCAVFMLVGSWFTVSNVW